MKSDDGITMLSFLTPFSSSMWLSIVIAYIMVSLMMFFVGRISPYERYRMGNPYQICSDGKHSFRAKIEFATYYFLIYGSKKNVRCAFVSPRPLTFAC